MENVTSHATESKTPKGKRIEYTKRSSHGSTNNICQNSRRFSIWSHLELGVHFFWLTDVL